MAVRARNRISPFEPAVVEAIARVLGDTAEGLTGTEIAQKLGQKKIPDIDPQNTKWKRLYNALADFQNRHGVGNHIIAFINEVMNPASYTHRRDVFERRRERLNAVLTLSGYEVDYNGQIKRCPKAQNLDEALARSNRMRHSLEQRGVHPEVLRFCSAEMIAENNFHAVFEAMKGITSRVCMMTGLTGDGAALVQGAFGCKTDGSPPQLVINHWRRKSERSEQAGFVNLLTGLYGMVRNPTAHEPRIEWPMTEEDGLDILTTISFVHRKLDLAKLYED